ncbi:MAG: PAS domain S-box protein [Chitinophagaceae bacterium]|nr:MAG: PAS domain S-box protein [Chitinophagaceae bacterium]
MLIITFVTFTETRKRAAAQNKQLFSFRKEQAMMAIDRRLNHYIQIMKGGKGLFMATHTLNREQWHLYVKTLELETNYPGIQGVGFAPVVLPEGIAGLQARMEAEGFPDFSIKPGGKRDIYTPIIMLEPFTGRNLRAFGFDMWSEPIRRAAMQRACDTNLPALSGRITLVQEGKRVHQPGFLLYLPLYNADAAPETVAERRASLEGFLYSPFRAGDLFRSLFKGDFADLDFEIYDGDKPSPENLLFDKSVIRDFFGPTGRHEYKALEKLQIAGQTWSVCISTMPGFGDNSSRTKPYLLLTGLLIISFLVFFIIVSVLNRQKSNQLKQIITDNATAAMFMMNAKGYCTFMNPAAEKMTGFTFDEIKQKPLHYMVHHHYPNGKPFPIQDCPIDRALPTNNFMRAYEDVFIRKDGSFFNISCAASPIFHNGTPVSTVIEVRDITEIKEAELRIREHVERLQKVFYHVPALVGLVSAADLIYVLVNPMFSHLFGDRPLLGKTLKEAHPELKDQNILEQILEVIDTGIARIGTEVKLHINRSNSSELSGGYFNYAFEPIFDDQQRVEAVLIFGVEVTELVRSRKALSSLNHELLHTNEELQRINIDLDNFVYSASHDLKSPITNIEGLSRALQDTLKEKLDEEEKQLLHLMEGSVHKLRKTVQELTEITKVQKQIQDEDELLYFNEILADVLNDINQLVEESKAEIITRFEVAGINYARKNLRSILYNLVSNAIRYRASDREPRIIVSTCSGNGKTVLSVQDNGLGIAKKQQHKLFTMFMRLHNHVEGSGIGLYIVKRIIENNGGRIEVESEPGVGSTFKVIF